MMAKAHDYDDDDDWLRSAVRTKASLQSFGAVIAMDMVLNNLDRIRTVRSWPESNPENIFLSKTTGCVVAIDSVAAWGDYAGALGESSFKQRMRDVQAVVAELIVAAGSEKNNSSEAFGLVRKLVRDGLSDTPLATKMWVDEDRKQAQQIKSLKGGDSSSSGGTTSTDTALQCAWPGVGVDIGVDGVAMVEQGFLSAVRRIVVWCSGGAGNRFEQVLAEVQSQLRAPTALLASREEWKAVMAGMMGNVGALAQFALDDGRVMVHAPTAVDTKDIEVLLQHSSPLCNPARCALAAAAYARGLAPPAPGRVITASASASASASAPPFRNVPLPDRPLCFAPDFEDWILQGKKTATTRVDHFVTPFGDTEIVGDLRRGEMVRAVTPDGRAFAVLSITNVEHRTVAQLDDPLAVANISAALPPSSKRWPDFTRR